MIFLMFIIVLLEKLLTLRNRNNNKETAIH